SLTPRSPVSTPFPYTTLFRSSSDLPCDAGDFRCERVELVHHSVDGVLEFEDFALHVDGDLLGKVAVGHGGRNFGDVRPPWPTARSEEHTSELQSRVDLVCRLL